MGISGTWVWVPVFMAIFNPGTCPRDYRGYAIARCQAKTTRQSYWHELRDHQEYCKKIAMKTGTHTQVPVPSMLQTK